MINGKRWTSWLGATVFLIFLFVVGRLIPPDFVDPWGLLKPRKIVQMIGALSLIQIMGAGLVQLLGVRAGTIISGFLSGLVSSTALTASLSHKSKKNTEKEMTMESLSYLSATLAMLVQAIILIVVGINEMHPSLLVLFIGPVGTTLCLLVLSSRRIGHHHLEVKSEAVIDIVSIVKLSIIIVGILALSKVLQNVFGPNGLEVFTFFVSLFEIHGSVIANVQLHDSGVIDLKLLGELLALSLAASYVSKLALVATLGHSFLKRRILIWTGVVLLSLLISWLFFHYFFSMPT